jgi:hypothetical protein
MNGIHVRGTTDLEEIAAVLALMRRSSVTPPRRSGLSVWRDQRQAAIAAMAHRRRPTEAR